MQRPRAAHRVLVVDLVARSVRCLEESPFGGVEPYIQRLHSNVEMRDLCSTHDRDIGVGAARNPGHRYLRGAYTATSRNLSYATSDLAVDFVAVKFLVRIMSSAGGPNRWLTCQEPAGQGTE